MNIIGLGSLVEFLSWPAFLLGLNAQQNGTNLFSNVYASIDDYGLLDREYRSWDGSLFIGDHFQATSSLMLDFGLRYERIGQFNDALGRNATFDVSRVDPNPPPTGSLAGYIVAANYPDAVPPGVFRAGNHSATYADGQNGLAPRLGFAWQPSIWGSRVVVRGGYGIYFSRPTGQTSFDRTHRFVLSGVYSFPKPPERLSNALFGGWSASGVLTLRSGTALTILYNNSSNVFGISDDRAQLAPGCGKANLVTSGSVRGKLGKYFNTPCFTMPPVIGADGIGTNFGDSATGIIDGPGQFNIDIGVMRVVPIRWPKEGSSLQLRGEFFNALNHPQFSNPNATYGSSSFGVITSTSVNPRVGQLAVKLVF